MIQPTMQLTINFSLDEFLKSETADKKNIKEQYAPTNDILNNINKLANILQSIRDKYGKPIYITSGYRCARLNKAVGGVLTSAHVKGLAVDVDVENNKELFNLIKQMITDKEINVDQLINENKYSWIHIGLSDIKNRNEIIHLSKKK